MALPASRSSNPKLQTDYLETYSLKEKLMAKNSSAQGNLGKDNIEALQKLQDGNAVNILAEVPQEYLAEAWAEANVELERAKKALQVAQQCNVRYKNAVVACRVIDEALRQELKREGSQYAKAIKDRNELQRSINQPQEVFANITVARVSEGSDIRKALLVASNTISAIEQRFGDALAQKYGFQTHKQAQDVSKFNQHSVKKENK